MKRSLAITSVAVTALFFLGGCGGAPPGAPDAVAEDCTPRDEGLETLEEGVLTVAQYEYVPFSMSEEPGTLTGLEGDVLTKFAELECLTLKVNKGDSAAMITSVATGRADTTLGSWYRTKERAEKVRLSAPVVTSPFSTVSKEGIETVDGLKDVEVGVGQGLIGVDDIKKVIGGKLKIYQNDDALFEDIKAGRVDAAVLGYIAGAQYLKKHEIEGFKVTPLKPDDRLPATREAGQTNFPVGKDNEQLGKAIDSLIQELRDSGELDKIAEKYDLDPTVMHPGEPNLL
ncbi:transporter substrate-binding domain-containing protein [Saxibacter everestensis]|uniref:Transporter substrate-binding domain-containing protein n=1 Tax=Saxibacter everestensis TaxID=2909229 RepID=A0ABY8QW75_9MICO|nr:transporter substrate-binding domain-containing protein [Brevibacteriaceae bacterium ZFBP1038]